MEFTVPASEFQPENVFACGQTFRYTQHGGRWQGIAMGSLVEAVPEGAEVRLRMRGREIPEAAWRRYFDLDCCYRELFPHADAVLREAICSAPGLRVLNQEPFETLISFIVSANNNIPRIAGIVEAVSRAAGDAFTVDGTVHHAFPEPAQLAGLSEQDLRRLGAGYRAPYILASSEKAAREDLDAVRDMPTHEVIRYLQSYPGVGPKVAACVALFAFGKRDAFPVDVWVRRIVRDLYGLREAPQAVQAFAEETFGRHAGIAQQYLFHYARRHLQSGS